MSSLCLIALSQFCQRLELAVGNTREEHVHGISYFPIFVGKLYSLYSTLVYIRTSLRISTAYNNVPLSPRPTTSLDEHMLKIGKVFDIRWAASSFKTMKTVINTCIYEALSYQDCAHLNKLSLARSHC